MSKIAQWNLINLFTFYVTAMFLIGTVRRLSQYRAVGGIVVNAPKRWPKLLELLKQHRHIFLTSTTLRPALLALVLVVVQTIASRLLYPQAKMTFGHVFDSWLIPILMIATGIPMIGIDGFFLIRVGRIDRSEIEPELDKAEGWLTSWKAPVIRALTFGYVDPRRMVSDEVKKALEMLNGLLNRNLYWMSAQVACRVLFGVALWSSWAFLVRGE